jgi:hypothetical protein
MPATVSLTGQEDLSSGLIERAPDAYPGENAYDPNALIDLRGDTDPNAGGSRAFLRTVLHADWQTHRVPHMAAWTGVGSELAGFRCARDL